MMIPETAALRPLRGLPGHWRPMLAERADGGKWVMKSSDDPNHVREEVLADRLYRAAGIHTPESAFRDNPLSGRLYRVSRYIVGLTLNEYALRHSEQQMDAVRHRLRQGLYMDMLLDNRDVIGSSASNIIVDSDGLPWRVDNGSALRWSAIHGPKPADWHHTVLTLRQWLQLPCHAYFYGPAAACAEALYWSRWDGQSADIPRDLRGILAERWRALSGAILYSAF